MGTIKVIFRPRHFLFFIGLVLWLVTTLASSQGADDADKRARELFLLGDRAYAEGDYEGALAAFEQAYGLSARHALLYNMANAHERLGQHEKALEKLRAFLPHASASQQKLIERRIQSLQTRLDDRKTTPSKPTENDPKLDENDPQQTVETRKEDSQETQGPTPPYLGYSLLGIGAIGIGVGTYFGVQALNARSDAKDACPEIGGARRCDVSTRDAIDRDRSNSKVADIGFGVGIVSAALGVWMILTHESGSAEKEQISQWIPVPRSQGTVDWVLHF